MSHYEQFVSMLDNAKQVSPMVFKRKSVNLTNESVYKVVEMESAAGKFCSDSTRTQGNSWM